MCWLPMVNPRNKMYKVWAFMLIAVDAVYTAFIVPISVGFRVSDTQWNWVAVTDFTAGAPIHRPCTYVTYSRSLMLRIYIFVPKRIVGNSTNVVPALV